jgi:hypothetical protein
MDEKVFFQMLPNIMEIDSNFKTLEGKIKIIPNFKGVKYNLVLNYLNLNFKILRCTWFDVTSY